MDANGQLLPRVGCCFATNVYSSNPKVHNFSFFLNYRNLSEQDLEVVIYRNVKVSDVEFSILESPIPGFLSIHHNSRHTISNPNDHHP